MFRQPPGLALDPGDPAEPSSSSTGCSSWQSSAGRGASTRLRESPAVCPCPAPSLPLTPSKGLSSMRAQKERKKKISYIFKHCLMVRSNIWSTALPLTHSPPSAASGSPHRPTNLAGRHPEGSTSSSVLALLHLLVARGQQKWPSGYQRALGRWVAG